jgi:hypothetical protein
MLLSILKYIEMLNMNNQTDAMLKQRIDAIFKKYDTKGTGTLSFQ